MCVFVIASLNSVLKPKMHFIKISVQEFFVVGKNQVKCEKHSNVVFTKEGKIMS